MPGSDPVFRLGSDPGRVMILLLRLIGITCLGAGLWMNGAMRRGLAGDDVAAWRYFSPMLVLITLGLVLLGFAPRLWDTVRRLCGFSNRPPER